MNAVADMTDRASRILDRAEYCGAQDDGQGGTVELWTLRKALGKHPKGSTIARGTLDRLLDEEARIIRTRLTP
jgi:hypothetical protein